jgi:SAM-dependent methyltransferase
MPRFLHVGCGPKRKGQTVAAFGSDEWDEVSLDIDESVMPDVVDKLPDLETVEAESYDAVYSAHNIEHLYPHEVGTALRSFLRILKSNGFAIITCPDLQGIGERIAAGDIAEPIYHSPMGPVSPLDMLYGFRPAVAKGNLYMAHHCGFTLKSLREACKEAGFRTFAGFRRVERYELWCLATKSAVTKDELIDLRKRYLVPV